MPKSIEKVGERYKALTSRWTAEEYPSGSFRLHRAEYLWLVHDVKPHAMEDKSGHSIVSAAIALGGFRRFLLAHSYISVMRAPDGTKRDLPPLPSFRSPRADDHVESFAITGSDYNLLRWCRRHGGVEPDSVLHEGVHIMGALATMPADTILYAADGKHSMQLEHSGIRLHLAMPFPPDLFPPQPPPKGGA